MLHADSFMVKMIAVALHELKNDRRARLQFSITQRTSALYLRIIIFSPQIVRVSDLFSFSFRNVYTYHYHSNGVDRAR